MEASLQRARTGRLVPVAPGTVVPPLADRFGGQPEWLGEPGWPVSAELGVPMRFIAQLRLPGPEPRLAYVFLTDDPEGDVDTFEPEGGENAVVIQPGGGSWDSPCAPLPSGPTLQDRQGREVQYLLQLDPGGEPRRDGGPDGGADGGAGPADEPAGEGFPGIQVGGRPCWLQRDETPAGHRQLLLQLDSARVPFWINFGDAGIGYVFVDESLSSGRLLWQSG